MNINKNILERYIQHGRKLPRRETQDPYKIHISEVMLQQTQVDRVIPYFYQWMKDFPDYEALARASKTSLLQHRSWLGFNSRALRLQECARKVVELYDGKLPQDRNQLLSLPWIWPYTSAAIMAFAWNLPVPVIDTNIRRVLIFLYKLPETISLKELEAFDKDIIPQGKSRDWHNALMDYGAMELTARKTKIRPLSRQSKFEGSDRQVRGWILKQLTKSSTPLSLSTIQQEFSQKNIKKIIDDMISEWLIIKKWTKLFLE